MSERIGRNKSAASTFTNLSLASPGIPTLANPIRSFGSQINTVPLQTVTEVAPFQEVQSADQQSLVEPEAIKEKPLSHDISRISLRRPQAKLTVGKPNDKYEQEADMMANQVMSMPDSAVQREIASEEQTLQTKPLAAAITPLIQRQAMPEESEEIQTKLSLQRATDSDLQAGDNIESRLNSSKGGGSPLSDEVRSFMEPRFGADFSQVRVHTGNEAVQMNQDLHAQAFTHKQDVYFGAGKAPAKDALTAHELTHVVQQTGTVQAKVMPITAAPTKIMRFAQGSTQIVKDDKGVGQYKGGTGHAGMTEEALHGMGLNADEARKGRMGNWERDMSQALTPGTVALLTAEGIMPILNILAIKEFGRGLNASEFGTYDPVEHIDNPTDLRGSDVFNQVDQANPQNDFTNSTNPDVGVTSKLKGTEGPSDKGYANVDRRYAATETKGKIMNLQDAKAFQVDESAIPRYMNTSKKWLTGKLHQSANLGRKKEDGLGPREFSSGIHTMQDFYAHSNFCEIGINILIREGGLEVVVEDDGKGNKKIETLGKDQVLNTQIHANQPDGSPEQKNLVNPNGTSKSGNKEVREVMTTGSFNLTDTAASVLEEVADKVKEMNPFDKSKKGPNEMIMACLDYMEMDEANPADFSALGNKVSSLINKAIPTILDLAPTAAAIAEKAGNLGASAVEKGASFGSGVLDVLNSANDKLGGDKDYFDSEKKALEGAGKTAAGEIQGTGDSLAEGIRNINTQLEAAAKAFEGKSHILRTAYQWAYENNPLKLIKAAAKKIPVIGEKVAAAIESLEQEVNKLLEDTLGAAWNVAVTKIVAKINKVIAKIREETNIQKKKKQSGIGTPGKLGGVSDLYDENGNPKEGIAPKSYTPPSHTEIAKDHDDIKNPVKDGKTDNPDEGLDHDRKDGDHAHNDDEHGHNHISTYLAPLATGLAKQASTAIGQKVAVCWDVVDAGGTPSTQQLGEIDQVVEQYFAHPADCDYWRSYFKAQLKTARIGGEVKRKLGNY
ncbi:eCIS core domain-containing protein [Nostoc sp.]|uniref:eCIS core domain-containing protein n=1 Tax=Nostoc sp. TaxID=1180 RepID=UPI002FFB4FC8